MRGIICRRLLAIALTNTIYTIGDISNWMDTTTGAFNYTGLVENMDSKAGMFYGMGLL